METHQSAALLLYCARECEALFGKLAAAIESGSWEGEEGGAQGGKKKPGRPRKVKKERAKRKPSAFNKFMKDTLATLRETNAGSSDKSNNDLFGEAVAKWRDMPADAKAAFTSAYKQEQALAEAGEHAMPDVPELAAEEDDEEEDDEDDEDAEADVVGEAAAKEGNDNEEEEEEDDDDDDDDDDEDEEKAPAPAPPPPQPVAPPPAPAEKKRKGPATGDKPKAPKKAKPVAAPAAAPAPAAKKPAEAAPEASKKKAAPAPAPAAAAMPDVPPPATGDKKKKKKKDKEGKKAE